MKINLEKLLKAWEDVNSFGAGPNNEQNLNLLFKFRDKCITSGTWKSIEKVHKKYEEKFGKEILQESIYFAGLVIGLEIGLYKDIFETPDKKDLN